MDLTHNKGDLGSQRGNSQLEFTNTQKILATPKQHFIDNARPKSSVQDPNYKKLKVQQYKVIKKMLQNEQRATDLLE